MEKLRSALKFIVKYEFYIVVIMLLIDELLRYFDVDNSGLLVWLAVITLVPSFFFESKIKNWRIK